MSPLTQRARGRAGRRQSLVLSGAHKQGRRTRNLPNSDVLRGLQVRAPTERAQGFCHLSRRASGQPGQ